MTVRGQQADAPTAIPPAGWWDVLKRVAASIGRHNLSMIAAGVAFHAIFALFPALAALVSLYGLLSNPADVERQLESLGGLLPPDVLDLVAQQLHSLATTSGGALSLSLIISVLIALWSATKGIKAMMVALNIVNEEEEERGFIRLNAVALALTAGGVLFVVFAVVLVAVLPAVLAMLGLEGVAPLLIRLLRWPLLAVGLIVALGVLYRAAPSRADPKWRWVSPGALAATLLWLAASAALSFYVSNFGSYNETYGSLGAVIVLLLWLYVSAYVVLVGAEVNAQAELQTARDTTTGRARPMGRRDARMADRVAR